MEVSMDYFYNWNFNGTDDWTDGAYFQFMENLFLLYQKDKYSAMEMLKDYRDWRDM